MQVDLWKKYIQWEKNNPLRTEDHTVITKRGNAMYFEGEEKYEKKSLKKNLGVYRVYIGRNV
jgi:hypothetical protein